MMNRDTHRPLCPIELIAEGPAVVAPDAELPFKLALGFAYVVPARTPAKIPRRRLLPATGPYVIRRYDPDGTTELETTFRVS